MLNLDERLIPKVSGDQLKLLAIIVDFANAHNNGEVTCWPSIRKMADRGKWSTDKVKRNLRQLIKAGFLKSEPRYRDNGAGQTSNLYTITTSLLTKFTPPANVHPPANSIGGDMSGRTPRGSKSTQAPPSKSASPSLLNSAPRPPAQTSDEVLGTEVLGTEVLATKVLATEVLGTEPQKTALDALLSVWPTFDDFWNLYDKKADRSKCLLKWNRIKQGAREKIMQHVPLYVQSTPDVQYRKNPLTYLNAESWNNEIINYKDTSHGNQRITEQGTRDRLNSYRDK